MIKQSSYLIRLIIVIWFVGGLSKGAISQSTPSLVVGIDTTDVAIKQVYDLYTDYLNAYPDRVYINPYWNEEECLERTSQDLPCDYSALFMYRGIEDAMDFFKIYPPKIISILKVEDNRYAIRVLFNNSHKGYEKFNPVYIVKLYAVLNSSGDYRLENAISYDTKNWRQFTYGDIQYIVSPNATFSKKEAKNAKRFSKKIKRLFGLKQTEQVKYYITNNHRVMGELFNFDYWLSYSTAITNTYAGEIYTSYGDADNQHELVHILLSSLASKTNNTMLINEGVATWLAGPDKDENFRTALNRFSDEIKNNDSLTIEMITNNEYRNQLDNNPIYLVGAVICDKVYELKGTDGIKEIMQLNYEDLKAYLEKLFNLPFVKVDKLIMDEIRSGKFEPFFSF